MERSRRRRLPSGRGLRDRVRSSMPRNGYIRSRMRRGQRQPQVRSPLPLLKLISPADLITLMNFICGVLAVMASVNGGEGYRIAMFLILLGIVFDGLDGPVARRFGSSHNFGMWLDSIADAMTFCIAPGILVYNMFKQPGLTDGNTIYNVLVIISSLSIAILGILRLARFSLSQHDWKDFIGLPTPALAMMVVSLTSLYYWSVEIGIETNWYTTGKPVIVPVLVLILSFAMVSDVLFRKYRGKVLAVAGFFLLVMMISLLFGVHVPEIGLMGSILFTAASFGYLISPIQQGPTKIWGAKRRLLDEFEEDELDDMIYDGDIYEGN
jgi:CDP-diacylglycerol--serine O-phosphatidyltransferase